MMRQVISLFTGITTPTNELYEQIARYGWNVTKVAWDTSINAFKAEGQDAYGQATAKTGPDAKTALANLLIAVARRTHLRTSAQHKVGMWKTMFTDQLQDIADAYAKAPAYDPKAAVYFKELADDSTRRAHVLGQQLHIEVTDNPEPYPNAQEMANDIHKNKHFLVSRANSEHPIWSVEQTIAFRVVHDVLGHAVSGGDFGWQGENLACAAHFPLLTPTAQLALFTECIAQTAYAAFYRSFGPQKVALFPQFIEGPQSDENPAAHRGVHPSQSVAPEAMPQIPPSPAADTPHEKGYIAPHMEPQGITPLANARQVRKYGSLFTDPNAGWTSGITPMSMQTDVHPKTGQPMGNAYLDHGDPLEADKVMDTASLIDTKWHQLPDRAMQKQAIVNAFRVVLLSPRKDLRWNAIHYQDIANIPGDVDTPLTYWNTLDGKRQEWNVDQVHQHYRPDLEAGRMTPEALDHLAEQARFSHQAWRKLYPKFFSLVLQQVGNHQDAEKKAQEWIYRWFSDEQKRMEMSEEGKPADKQMTQDEIDRKAQAGMVKRMELWIEDHKPKMDSLFGRVADNLFDVAPEPTVQDQRPKIVRYGAFMGGHLKAISQISQHADEILDAAIKDVHEHDGTGHHFRAQVLQLGVSGVGPKVCSFAWLLLQPLTSQLATIDTHMCDVLGHKFEKDLNNRDYFRFERELQAGRDASGYGHVPLGAFQWGMWDYKRTGPGTHQDHSAMKVLNPTPHWQIDWEKKAQNLKAEEWLKQGPDWWQNTEPARTAVREHWDNNVAPNTPASDVPYQVADDSMERAASHVAKGESKNEFHVGFTLPEELFKKLATIADKLPIRKDDPENYHITAFWSEEGYDRQELHRWIMNASVSGLRFTNARIDTFPSNATDDKWAVVLKLDAPEAKELVTKLIDEAEDHGLDIKRFPGGWKAHITLGWSDEEIDKEKFPEIEFRTGPMYVSIPRPLRKVAPGLTQHFAVLGVPTKMQRYQNAHPGLSTPEIWKLYPEESNDLAQGNGSRPASDPSQPGYVQQHDGAEDDQPAAFESV